MGNLTNIINYLKDFNALSIFIRLILAVGLSALMGIERGRKGRAAGLRTHILVCLGATMTSMTGIFLSEQFGSTGDLSRIAAQVVSGIGFLGAGTILVKNNSTVTGLTTAACVWATGAIGIAIGYGFYEAAIIATVLTFLTVKLLSNIEQRLSVYGKEFNIYVEFKDASRLNDTIFLFKNDGFLVENITLAEAKANTPNSIAANITIKCSKKENAQEILKQINDLENVNFAVINYSIIT